MSTATDMLAKYLAAEQAILEGKEVRLGDRLLKMEDLPNVIAGRREWEQRVSAESVTTARAPKIGGMTFSLASFNGGGR